MSRLLGWRGAKEIREAHALRAAVTARRTNAIDFLDQQGVQWDPVSAVLAGRAEVLRRILLQNSSTVTNVWIGRSLLHLAAQNGDVESARILVAGGIDLRAQDAWGLSPLGRALLSQRHEFAAFLREQGATEITPLHLAAMRGCAESAAVLLRNQADPHLLTEAPPRGRWIAPLGPGRGTLAGNTALHLAAMCGQPQITRLLIGAGLAVNTPNANGRTALDLTNLAGMDRPDFWLEREMVNACEPLAPAEPAQLRAPAALVAAQKQTASFLEQFGGERTTPTQPRPRRPALQVPPP